MGQFCPVPLTPLERARPALKHAHLHRRRFRFRPASRTDRPASRRPAQRLAPARRHRRRAAVDRVFRELPGLLEPGDLLVFNDTKVVKARLFGEKATGGKLELLVERVLQDQEVVAHMKVSKKPPAGAVLAMHGGFTATLLGAGPTPTGRCSAFRFSDEPLRADGAARPCAAAALHRTRRHGRRRASATRPCSRRTPARWPRPRPPCISTKPLLAALDARGVRRASVTLHVGAGTFQPVKGEKTSPRTACTASGTTCPKPRSRPSRKRRARGGRVVAVGTTTVRTLESWALSGPGPRRHQHLHHAGL